MASDTLLLHLGTVLVTFSPNPFSLSSYFNQSFHLETSSIIVQAGGSSAETALISLRLFVDANSDTIYIDMNAQQPVITTVTLQSTRPTSPFSFTFYCDYCAGTGFPGLYGPDVIVDPLPSFFPDPEHTLAIYHRNDASLEGDWVSYALAQQSLSSLADTVNNQWLNRTFGVAIDAPAPNSIEMKRIDANTLISTEATTSLSGKKQKRKLTSVV